jgi:DNA-binding transcriptional LysR family regulator
MQINLNQLRAFYLTVKEGSVTRAADTLYVTQPAVTMQIKTLEKRLEAKLFRKYGKNQELTEAGQALFGYAGKIFAVVEEMEYAMRGFMELSHGSLTIGTTRSFAKYLMPGLVSRFQERFPAIRVYLREGSSREIADGLLAFQYDLGIIGSLPFDDKLKIIPYSKEEFCLITSPAHRFAEKGTISFRDLQSEPIIIREQGSGSRHAILSILRSNGINPSVLVEAGSVEFIKEYVMKGRGISFLYKPEVAREVEQGQLHSLRMQEDPLLIRTHIAFPRDADLSPPAKAFLGIIKSKK